MVAAGCGGDDETTSTSTTAGATGTTGAAGASLTHEQFVAQADAICVAGDKTIETAAQALGQSPTEAVLEQAVTDSVVPALQQQHDAIAALPAPEGEETQVDDLLSNLQEGIDALEEDPTLVTAATQRTARSPRRSRPRRTSASRSAARATEREGRPEPKGARPFRLAGGRRRTGPCRRGGGGCR